MKASLNLAIIFSLKSLILEAVQVTDFEWLLFYPCVYSYALWHAFNRAIEINRALDNSISEHTNSFHNGIFIGCAMGGTLGVIYLGGVGPIWGGLLGMGSGAIIGLIIQRYIMYTPN